MLCILQLVYKAPLYSKQVSNVLQKPLLQAVKPQQPPVLGQSCELICSQQNKIMPVFFSPLRLLWQKHMGQHIITMDKCNTIFCNKDPSVSVYLTCVKGNTLLLESSQIISLFATAVIF